ncbi:MAG: type I restriction endonuclease subunit R [Bdellovibrionota bacterium]
MKFEFDAYGKEFRAVELPILEFMCEELGYEYLAPTKNPEERDGENNVILRNLFKAAVTRINNVGGEVSDSVYQELLGLSDNEKWLKIIRGEYSKTVPGESEKKTIALIDFKNPKNNTFTVANQFKVHSEKPRRPDLVVFINGLPLVVIEAKSPFSFKDKSGEAFDQIRQYEEQIPRLFYSNAFNITTNEQQLLYGATGAPSKYWGFWRDPWPKDLASFKGDDLKKSLWCLLEPSRILDLIAHFIVFEREKDEDGRIHVVKKMARYQQFRAVNKITERIHGGQVRRGLIWHTQGSGKSLTMAYAAVKLRTHLTVDDDVAGNPNILVLTDRVDLDTQIKDTFVACSIRNPQHIDSVKDLHEAIKKSSHGLTLISTIFKFQGSKQPVPKSENWVILVDECHRTQEKDLGAYLRATFPDAMFFGFTGTPVKKNDRNTYENFSPPGENYLDKYGIDDAVADGATVPIHFTSRKAEFEVDAKKLDQLFDQTFADTDEEQLNKIKSKGVGIAEILKHQERINDIAYDIWVHYKAQGLPDGLKAQIVVYDREAIILYKRALNQVIADDLKRTNKNLSDAQALQEADEMSQCVFSSNQEDGKPSEQSDIQTLREDLRKYYLDQTKEKQAKKQFKTKGANPKFLIVCDKLLTGFDAPIEGFMYLDTPLSDHNLLQAIARTNRVWSSGKKDKGLIVDYIGVSKKLDKALAAYRKEDVQSALRNISELEDILKKAHAEVSKYLSQVDTRAPNIRDELRKLMEIVGTLDEWFKLKTKIAAFVKAYENLSPEPSVLQYTADLKWAVTLLSYGTMQFEKKESQELQDVSEKIRKMLEEHVEVTGIRTVCKIRQITDPEFQEDFKTSGKNAPELKEAATRKAAALKKYTREKTEENDVRYRRFSEKVLEIIQKLEQGQVSEEAALKEMKSVSDEIEKEVKAYEKSGLSPTAYDILQILRAFRYESDNEKAEKKDKMSDDSTSEREILNALKEVAEKIEATYQSEEKAPPGFHLRAEMRKELRAAVRRILQPTKLKGWEKDLPFKIEEYALKHFIKVG